MRLRTVDLRAGLRRLRLPAITNLLPVVVPDPGFARAAGLAFADLGFACRAGFALRAGFGFAFGAFARFLVGACLQLVGGFPLLSGLQARVRGVLLLQLLDARLEQLTHLGLQAVVLLHQRDDLPLALDDRLLQRLHPLAHLLGQLRHLPHCVPRLNALPLPPSAVLLPGQPLEPALRPEHLIHPARRERREVRAGQRRSTDGTQHGRIGTFHILRRLRQRGLERLRPTPFVPSPA
ncbi:hypothetical protein E0H50_07005 [Kribbella sindirgiensis]|uniref:Uncharacterized protein n=1 Tax=Kribbella sindirgiensis TaxID=1124744 RepID=A0A4V2M5F9_9ACTN|nr:hypothetical protein E0H50_07005 [Kribbella sindirgiensis]